MKNLDNVTNVWGKVDERRHEVLEVSVQGMRNRWPLGFPLVKFRNAAGEEYAHGFKDDMQSNKVRVELNDRDVKRAGVCVMTVEWHDKGRVVASREYMGLIEGKKMEKPKYEVIGGEEDCGGGNGGGGLPEGGEPFKQLVTDADGKTVWEERPYKNVTEETLFEPKSVALTSSYYNQRQYNTGESVALVDGNTYIVDFNGTKYECVAHVEEQANNVENGVIIGEYNTGVDNDSKDIPFYGFNDDGALWFYVHNSAVPEGDTCTFGVVHKIVDIKTIDPDLIGGWKALGEGEPVKTALVDNVTVTLADTGGGVYVYGTTLEITLVVGTTYFVTWDGVDYECDAYEIADTPGDVMIGNASMLGNAGGNGEPFLIISTGGSASIVGQDANTHTISMFINEAEIIPIPNNYLPLATQEAPGAIKVYKLPHVVPASIMERAIEAMNAGSARVFFGDMELFYGRIENDVLYCAWVNDPARSCKVAKSEGKFNSYIWERNVYNTVIASNLYLGSGSGKLFRIQVSDDGTLSATEVT